jgi:hypothetical protein
LATSLTRASKYKGFQQFRFLLVVAHQKRALPNLINMLNKNNSSKKYYIFGDILVMRNVTRQKPMDYRLPIPRNWQDFESICQKLWAEIWNDLNTENHSNMALSPGIAADIIVHGMETNKARVMVGKDAKFMDFLVRLNPAKASKLIFEKMKSKLEK